MKTKTSITAIGLAMFFISGTFAQNLTVMTYNIRVDIPVDTSTNIP